MDVFGIALSGMHAASTLLETAASNIANADSAGYKAARANLKSGPGGEGVVVDSITTDSSPQNAGDIGNAGADVDLPHELVNLDRAALLYKANAAVIRVGEQMMGSLLDIFDTSENPGNSKKAREDTGANQ